MKAINLFQTRDVALKTVLLPNSCFLCLIAVFAMPLAACSNTATAQEVEMATPIHKEDRFEKAVREYVYKNKGWSKDAYSVEFKSRQGDTLVYWVLHRDDELSDEVGGGKSIEVHINAENLEVLRELHFQ